MSIMTALEIKNDVFRLLLGINDTTKLTQVKDFLESNIVELSKEAKIQQFKDNVQEAFEEIRLHQEGKIELQTAEELLNEL